MPMREKDALCRLNPASSRAAEIPLRVTSASVSSVARRASTHRPPRRSVYSVLRLERHGGHGESRFGCGQVPRCSTGPKLLLYLRRISAIVNWPRMAELPIFDWSRLAGPIDGGGNCHTTSSIVNRRSAIGNKNRVFGCGRAALSGAARGFMALLYASI
jgi:hypothetical protein